MSGNRTPMHTLTGREPKRGPYPVWGARPNITLNLSAELIRALDEIVAGRSRNEFAETYFRQHPAVRAQILKNRATEHAAEELDLDTGKLLHRAR